MADKTVLKEANRSATSNTLPSADFSFTTAMGGNSNGSWLFGLPPVFGGANALGGVNTGAANGKYNETLIKSFHYLAIEPVAMTPSGRAEDESIAAFSPRRVTATSHLEAVRAVQQLAEIAGVAGCYPPFVYALQRRSFMESFSNQYQESFFQTQGSRLTGSGLWATVAQTRGQRTPDAKEMAAALSAEKGMAGEMGGMLGMTGKTGSQAISMIRGGRIDLPKIWGNSEWSFNNSFEMKFISPSANPQDIRKFVMLPIFMLMLCTCPISKDKGDTYIPSPFVAVTLPGFWKYKLCGIRDLSVTWGGDTASFSMNQLPLIADVSLTVEPLKVTVESLMENGELQTDPDIPNVLSRFMDIEATDEKDLAWMEQGQNANRSSKQFSGSPISDNPPMSTPGEANAKKDPFSSAHNKAVAHRLQEVS